MKKLSSIFYMWFGFGSAIIAVLAMLFPFINVDGSIKPATYFFFNGPGDTSIGAWPAFVGFMLILLAGLSLGTMAFPFVQPTAKVEKIVLISSFIGLVIGFFLVAFMGVLFALFNSGVVVIVYLFGYYISLIGIGLAAIANFIALKLDW